MSNKVIKFQTQNISLNMTYIFGIINFETENESVNFSRLIATYENKELQTKVIYDKNGIQLGIAFVENKPTFDSIFETEKYLVFFEGRVFNHNDLKKKIVYQNLGSCFLEAFLKWGNTSADYLNGEYSVVIINKETKQIDFFRDHIGVSSLSYSINTSRFIFASHPYEIAESRIVEITYNELYLLTRRLKLKTNYEFTFFNEIKRVIPGYHYSINGCVLKKEKYWQPDKIKRNNLSRKEAVLKLKGLLTQAVKNRLVNAPMGVHVSGGIDCTGVASLLSDLNQAKETLTGYSWTPLEKNTTENEFGIQGGNEKEFIDHFSQIKNVPIYYVNENLESYQQRVLIPEFEHMSIEYPIMVKANQDEINLMFSGWGGDEFLSLSNRGIYAHFFFTFKWHKIISLMSKTSITQVLVKLKNEVLPQLNPLYKKQQWDKLKDELVYFDSNFVKKHIHFLKKNLKPFIYSKKGRNQFILNLLYNYHLPSRMDSWSYFSTKFGFRYTYPLLDKEVLDYWFSLPLELTYDIDFSRGLYRDVMLDILDDKIRLRKDKTENLRIQHSFYQTKESIAFFLKEIEKYNIEVNQFESKQTILKSALKNTENKLFPTIIKTNRLIHYINESILLKKYFRS